MVDKADDLDNSYLISQLTSAGISLATLESAAYTAKQMCMGSTKADADAFNPYHANDYHNLIAELSCKTAK